MASSVVSGLTEVFKSQALGPFAAQSGESESSVLRGFEATVGTMVAGLGSKMGQTGFARQVFDLISSPANDTGVLDNVRNVVTNGPERSGDAPGPRFLSMLFDGGQSAVTDVVSRASGLRSSSAASLLSLGAPLLLGYLGKRVREGGMDASRLTNFVSREAAGVKDTLPAGASALFGTKAGDASATPPPVATGVVREGSAPPVATGVVREPSKAWLWPLLLALIVLVGLIWWLARRPHAVIHNTYNTVFLTRRLPDNVTLQIPQGRMEDHLLAFIQDPSRPVDDTTWFDFDRLLFDTNSTTLQASSEEQLHNVAEILKAYPNVHAKIGGYTDNTGDANGNQVLSQQRADNVKQQLVNMGISADRLEAEGYGDQHPVADNSTEEGRQRNRRISMRVTQK